MVRHHPHTESSACAWDGERGQVLRRRSKSTPPANAITVFTSRGRLVPDMAVRSMDVLTKAVSHLRIWNAPNHTRIGQLSSFWRPRDPFVTRWQTAAVTREGHGLGGLGMVVGMYTRTTHSIVRELGSGRESPC